MFCGSLCVLSFFFWPLCSLSFFDLRILITPLVSSSSTYPKQQLMYSKVVVWKESLNSDCHHSHQYQQRTLTSHKIDHNVWSWTSRYWLETGTTCGVAKQFNEISIRSLDVCIYNINIFIFFKTSKLAINTSLNPDTISLCSNMKRFLLRSIFRWFQFVFRFSWLYSHYDFS